MKYQMQLVYRFKEGNLTVLRYDSLVFVLNVAYCKFWLLFVLFRLLYNFLVGLDMCSNKSGQYQVTKQIVLS